MEKQAIDILKKLGDAGWRWAIDGPLDSPVEKWKASIEKGDTFYIEWGPTPEMAIFTVAMRVSI